jgi:hypothetical protein
MGASLPGFQWLEQFALRNVAATAILPNFVTSPLIRRGGKR